MEALSDIPAGLGPGRSALPEYFPFKLFKPLYYRIENNLKLIPLPRTYDVFHIIPDRQITVRMLSYCHTV